MADLKTFYYDHQLKNYLVQFMAIFANMNVQVGWNEDTEPRLIKVPIYSASKDRVVAAIKSENTQNKPIRLPSMSAWLMNLEVAPERRKGVPNKRRTTFLETGGLFPEDIKVAEQRMPVPYNAFFELNVWASNQDQHYQILEQIMMIFGPNMQVQTSDDTLDWTQITQVEMQGINLEENVPAGQERRIIHSSLLFAVPIWISAPANVHDKYVKDIFMRVGAVSTAAKNSYDIVAELDAQGLPYEMNFSLDDIDLD